MELSHGYIIPLNFKKLFLCYKPKIMDLSPKLCLMIYNWAALLSYHHSPL